MRIFLFVPCCLVFILTGLDNFAHVQAQPASNVANYPAKPIRLIAPFTPGGSADILARAVGAELSKAWGQPVLIENLPGAAGSIGAERVAKSAPDGYTLLMGHIGTLAVNPSLYPRLPYQPLKDFVPVAFVARVPNVLVVHPNVKAGNVPELLALAQAHPGQLSYGSGGNGSGAHLATEYLKLKTGISMLHIPYRGTAPAVTDLVGGQIQVLFSGVPAVLQHIKAGHLRALTVSSSQRLDSLPEVPTLASFAVSTNAPNSALSQALAGLKNFEADQWYGVVAPVNTPVEIVSKLNAHINASLNTPELKNRLNAEGAITQAMSSVAFGQLIAREIARWKPVIQSGRIKAD